jgi:hypothetical protein
MPRRFGKFDEIGYWSRLRDSSLLVGGKEVRVWGEVRLGRPCYDRCRKKIKIRQGQWTREERELGGDSHGELRAARGKVARKLRVPRWY